MTIYAYQAIIRRGTYTVPGSDCIYINGKVNKLGYISLKWKGTAYKAHRLSYENYYGELSPLHVIDHICHNKAALTGTCAGGNTCEHRRCINPSHLRAITQQEHILASVFTAPGRGAMGNALINLETTHCPQGHEYNSINTYIWNRPGSTYTARMCRACIRDRARERRSRNIAAGLTNTGNPRKRMPK